MKRSPSAPTKTDPQIRISIQPNIGLDEEIRGTVVDQLNVLLADEVVLNMKTRSIYWQLNGHLSLKFISIFDQQIHQLNCAMDEIAERINILGGVCLFSFEEILNATHFKEKSTIPASISLLTDDHETLIRLLRDDIQAFGGIYDDQGTFLMLISILRVHEKIASVLRSFVEPD